MAWIFKIDPVTKKKKYYDSTTGAEASGAEQSFQEGGLGGLVNYGQGAGTAFNEGGLGGLVRHGGASVPTTGRPVQPYNVLSGLTGIPAADIEAPYKAFQEGGLGGLVKSRNISVPDTGHAGDPYFPGNVDVPPTDVPPKGGGYTYDPAMSPLYNEQMAKYGVSNFDPMIKPEQVGKQSSYPVYAAIFGDIRNKGGQYDLNYIKQLYQNGTLNNADYQYLIDEFNMAYPNGIPAPAAPPVTQPPIYEQPPVTQPLGAEQPVTEPFTRTFPTIDYTQYFPELTERGLNVQGTNEPFQPSSSVSELTQALQDRAMQNLNRPYGYLPEEEAALYANAENRFNMNLDEDLRRLENLFEQYGWNQGAEMGGQGRSSLENYFGKRAIASTDLYTTLAEQMANRRMTDEQTSLQSAMGINEQLYGQARGDFADMLGMLGFEEQANNSEFTRGMELATLQGTEAQRNFLNQQGINDRQVQDKYMTVANQWQMNSEAQQLNLQRSQDIFSNTLATAGFEEQSKDSEFQRGMLLASFKSDEEQRTFLNNQGVTDRNTQNYFMGLAQNWQMQYQAQELTVQQGQNAFSNKLAAAGFEEQSKNAQFTRGMELSAFDSEEKQREFLNQQGITNRNTQTYFIEAEQNWAMQAEAKRINIEQKRGTIADMLSVAVFTDKAANDNFMRGMERASFMSDESQREFLNQQGITDRTTQDYYMNVAQEWKMGAEEFQMSQQQADQEFQNTLSMLAFKSDEDQRIFLQEQGITDRTTQDYYMDVAQQWKMDSEEFQMSQQQADQKFQNTLSMLSFKSAEDQRIFLQQQGITDRTTQDYYMTEAQNWQKQMDVYNADVDKYAMAFSQTLSSLAFQGEEAQRAFLNQQGLDDRAAQDVIDNWNMKVQGQQLEDAGLTQLMQYLSGQEVKPADLLQASTWQDNFLADIERQGISEWANQPDALLAMMPLLAILLNKNEGGGNVLDSLYNSDPNKPGLLNQIFDLFGGGKGGSNAGAGGAAGAVAGSLAEEVGVGAAGAGAAAVGGGIGIGGALFGAAVIGGIIKGFYDAHKEYKEATLSEGGQARRLVKDTIGYENPVIGYAVGEMYKDFPDLMKTSYASYMLSNVINSMNKAMTATNGEANDIYNEMVEDIVDRITVRRAIAESKYDLLNDPSFQTFRDAINKDDYRTAATLVPDINRNDPNSDAWKIAGIARWTLKEAVKGNKDVLTFGK